MQPAPHPPHTDRRPGAAFRNLPANLRVSVAALIISNLWPLIGVLFLGWDVFMVMFLFWFENVIIGFYNVLKMLTARGKSVVSGCASYFFLIPFFIVHYGIFCMVHGMLIVGFFGMQRVHVSSPADLLPIVFTKDLLGPAFILFLSHGVSFVVNFLNSGEYKDSSAHGLMGQPYVRIIILHLTILGGGFLVALTGSARPAIAILVLLKIAIDVAAHVAEHRGKPLLQKFAARRMQEFAAQRAKNMRSGKPLDR